MVERGSGDATAAASSRDSGEWTEDAFAPDAPFGSFRAVVERSPELILVHRAGAIVYANRAAAEALGYAAAEELVGVAWRDLVHPVQKDHRAPSTPPPPPMSATSLRPLARCDPPPPSRTPEQITVRKKDGAPLALEIVSVPLESEGDREWLLVLRDTSREDGRERDLRADHVAALGTLAAGVAHEINNPLTYVLVHLEHVTRRLRAVLASARPRGDFEEQLTPDDVRGFVESLGAAIDGARKVRETVRHLMTFSHGTSERRSVVDVRAVLESALQMTWHELRPRARVVKQLAETPPVEANEARLGQVFLGLLKHAARAIPDGAADAHEVRVSSRTDADGRAVVEIRDTGEAIDASTLPRIFDPFHERRPGSNAGLGLAIAQGTVRALGGEISVESAPGQGTTMRVVLPAASGWVERHRAVRPRVIIVDADEQVANALALALDAECEVEVTTRASEVLERLAAGERFAAIVCDLTMPDVSGIDLYAQAIRVAPDAVGRIVFTSGGTFTPRARAFLDGVRNVCLDKPIDERELRALVRRWGREGLR